MVLYVTREPLFVLSHAARACLPSGAAPQISFGGSGKQPPPPSLDVALATRRTGCCARHKEDWAREGQAEGCDVPPLGGGGDPASGHPGAQQPPLGRAPPPSVRGVHLDAPGQRRGPLPSSVWTRHRAVNQGQSGGSVGTTFQGKGRVSRDVRVAGSKQGEGGHKGGRGRWAPLPADGGKGFKERARVSGEGPMGAARCRQQYNPVSCQPPPPPGSTHRHTYSAIMAPHPHTPALQWTAGPTLTNRPRCSTTPSPGHRHDIRRRVLPPSLRCSAGSGQALDLHLHTRHLQSLRGRVVPGPHGVPFLQPGAEQRAALRQTAFLIAALMNLQGERWEGTSAGISAWENTGGA